MRLRNVLAAASILGACALSAAPASARHAERAEGHALALQLAFTTERLHDLGDGRFRQRGRYGYAMAEALHGMDVWADYYRKAVERHGFRSRMARQRFDRFLVEYREACVFLDRPGARGEVGVLHATVAELSEAYGRAYCAAIPGARFEPIERAGHFPHLEQPQQFADKVFAFIERA